MNERRLYRVIPYGYDKDNCPDDVGVVMRTRGPALPLYESPCITLEDTYDDVLMQAGAQGLLGGACWTGEEGES